MIWINRPRPPLPPTRAEAAPRGTHNHIIVVCVLRTGGCYDWGYVRRLHAGVRRHLTMQHDFVCLTNSLKAKGRAEAEADGVRVVELRHRWPGWWSKIELFSDWMDLNGARILYLDLDTLITGPLDDLASFGGDFGMLRDFFRPERPASGVMAWNSNIGHEIYHKFSAAPEQIMTECGVKGDQVFIPAACDTVSHFLQDYVPGQIVSWKVGPVDDAACVVCFHGKPKPHELLDLTYIKAHWRE